jgi:hypothetical protein
LLDHERAADRLVGKCSDHVGIAHKHES